MRKSYHLIMILFFQQTVPASGTWLWLYIHNTL